MQARVPKVDPALRHSVLSTKAVASNQHTQTAVLKATSAVVGPPKKKHVQYLMQYLRRGGPPQKVAKLLSERTKELPWMVAFKALCVYHLLMRDGDKRFLAYLSQQPTVFGHMHSYNDHSRTDGFAMSCHIRSYSNYLEEKVAVYRQYGRDFVAQTHADRQGVFAQLSNRDVFKAMEGLQGQVDALLGVQMTSHDLSNGTAEVAYVLLMRDCIKLFVALNSGVMVVLDRFFNMKLADAQQSLALYQRFVEQTGRITSFLEVGKRLDHASSASLPDLKAGPTTLLGALQDYVDGLDVGQSKASVSAQAKEEVEKYRLTGPADAMTSRHHNVERGEEPSGAVVTQGLPINDKPGADVLGDDLNLLSFEVERETVPIADTHSLHTVQPGADIFDSFALLPTHGPPLTNTSSLSQLSNVRPALPLTNGSEPFAAYGVDYARGAYQQSFSQPITPVMTPRPANGAVMNLESLTTNPFAQPSQQPNYNAFYAALGNSADSQPMNRFAFSTGQPPLAGTASGSNLYDFGGHGSLSGAGPMANTNPFQQPMTASTPPGRSSVPSLAQMKSQSANPFL